MTIKHVLVIPLKLIQAQLGRPLKLLFLGAHSDDIEIGCGAMVLESLHQVPCEVMWSVFSGSGGRTKEARASARDFLRQVSKPKIEVLRYRESFFPEQWSEIKKSFEELRKKMEPDVVFTHNRNDRHQDHRVLSDLTWNTFRNHLVLEYEIPKYDGDLGQPSCFFPVSAARAQEKADLLQKHFNSQGSKHWFDRSLFLGLMRLRGMECAAESGYAEAFYARKWVVNFSRETA